MTVTVDTSKSLDELDPPAWGTPSYDSNLVRSCHRLRKKPIGEFSVEDLRIMIGQGIGLRWLIPLALDVLEVEPLAEGDFFRGDLLSNVLRAPKTSWEYGSELRRRVQRIVDRLGDPPKELSGAITVFRANTV